MVPNLLKFSVGNSRVAIDPFAQFDLTPSQDPAEHDETGQQRQLGLVNCREEQVVVDRHRVRFDIEF